jgi:predicted AAA+ superfamily ATPase
MEIQRDIYLQRLIHRKENGMVKVITGIRRCGKSYLLFHLFFNYLISIGVDESHVIRIALDDERYEELHSRKVLGEYVRSRMQDSDMYYLFLDEIQNVEEFEKLLNGLNRVENLDIYVTGSNSKFLSSDILTEFRGRGDEVRLFPLSFSEFYSVFSGTKTEAWNLYSVYGGMPQIVSQRKEEQKVTFLKNLFAKVYLDDIISRNHLRGDRIMDALADVLASSVGSLTNPSKLANTFISHGFKNVSDKTISSYIEYLSDAFLISKAVRYDVKGRKYISSPYKYYYCDVGLRNARLEFRQYEETHLMENIIYNELLIRGYSVDVGVITHDVKNVEGKISRKQLEVDFIANQGSKRYYIQSAFAIPDREKMEQEQASLTRIPDSFRKIIIVGSEIPLWHNEEGITIMNIYDFLLNINSLDF